jgi:flagellar FliL protein
MEEEEFEDETSGGSPILGILLLLVLVLLGIVGYLGYIMSSKGFFSDEKEENKATTYMQSAQPAINVQKMQDEKIMTEKVDKVDPYDKPNPMMFSGSVENLVLNIVNNRGREKLMKLSYSLEGPYEMMEMLIEKHKDAIVDATIRITATSSSNELLTIGGKINFNAMLKNEINKIINEKEKMNSDIPKDVIKKIYFKSFVMR